MLIELKWLDGNNSRNHRTEIWRSLTPFTDTTEAELITTTQPGEDTYADADVIQGNKYYYRFRNILGTLKSPLSKQFEFEANQYTGPGPQKLIFGDEHFGYYGPLPLDADVVPTVNQIRELFSLSPVSNELNSALMYKFSVGGSVRGIHTVPMAIGSEIAIDNPMLVSLFEGGVVNITLGLHTWSLILPSTGHATNPSHTVEHFPGELRSMLGVVSEMYSRVEDATTGNNTGRRLLPDTGQVQFYTPLEERYPETTVQWIVSSDWTESTATVINWTTKSGPPPARPSELHTEEVDYSVPGNWEKTLIWPVVVYTGLTGPT